MKAGIFSLVLAYVLSQFYRAFLAVMSPVLIADLGVSAADLADASGVWFLAFAAMQIPVGIALDRVGPRLTSAVVFGLGAGGGAALFAVATSGQEVTQAMALIGVGCSPVLMANYYIFARVFSARVFGTLAGVVIGVGSFGNIASSLPLAVALEVFGWRGSLWVLAGISLAVAGLIALLVRDPASLPPGPRGSLMDILRIRALWFIFPIMAVNYLPAAGLRGLWAGPYFADIYGLDAGGIGRVTLAMGVAMVLGNFAYGPLDRVFGTRKWLVFGGNALACAALVALWALPLQGVAFAVVMLAAVGFFGASFPMVMAHGRAFFPPHLVGRGVTLMNLFGIGATGLAQVYTGHLNATAASPQAGYVAIFGFFAVALMVGLSVYLFSRDRTD
ncbi:Sugar phosphate permease [Pseudorhodobacter antarcticus]|uniref:Sugar phosphate permease n=1 Tax=Pseudorhodobacter antarcticus TaxID=1077947 RepID=A0A1H8AKN0_9RHOB|nr:MFS transporter [Pseudorhodobacter antarcticus]SEM71073.1 Sugar phosphate permease [Pseudorhodobacter antarcticus]